ncbi:similar to Saccharomyces cerevisiae YCL005W-A VMA9 Vacuolar H+ ATPase subunit e of the V-ATPase V0 subcomplex [Maudiozyma barnettii]|uniref:Similar to Saccharomyces cerevisiae YCL005W-A VMA9 Vacuolar H+ ATPase subunit e of the V-ATPase V0 subcomplex n=1 Tax=Maudiozyma barnettii TaxID=61262 RepID=A0A8H2VJG3_9SACH|nr:uncharacterized protein KABA2_10S01870 [Kazachstania barnettii]CAB4256557.1 similar to Saccharomyces cerevisiae YCL005W-A VMA9 Vacuolar H+ ATPase subunit e of the V-ATPase V0 subcomplex [Kazachstania barnettii]CAD1785160.1 similar to Saccharomyces cerevisiae YCL005W-A VMA9 Vacuolar H+ ATPase subunit e of the V-ATPase V0 subcomplex [Kazachstania barnettii]
MIVGVLVVVVISSYVFWIMAPKENRTHTGFGYDVFNVGHYLPVSITSSSRTSSF